MKVRLLSSMKEVCVLTFYLMADACISGKVRLSGSSFANQGRVEVCVNNTWGTICPDYWDSNEAAVVCHQLGYQRIGNCTCPFV